MFWVGLGTNPNYLDSFLTWTSKLTAVGKLKPTLSLLSRKSGANFLYIMWWN